MEHDIRDTLSNKYKQMPHNIKNEMDYFEETEKQIFNHNNQMN